MLTKEELEAMARVNITEVDPSALVDLQEVKITGETPAQRLESYLAQVGNPYCFRVGATPVKIKFAPDGKSLEEKLKKHFLSLKTGDFPPEL